MIRYVPDPDLTPTEPRRKLSLVYETQLGHQEQARDLLKHCFQIDPKFREIALEEVDLEPLWMAIIV